MNVHLALSYLEGLCQSEDAEGGSGSSFFSANVCIQPPDDVQGESDKDSGDEEARNLVISAVVSYWLLPLLKYMTRLEEELLEPIITMKLKKQCRSEVGKEGE